MPEPPPQRKRHEILGKVLNQHAGPLQQRLPQVGRSGQRRAVVERARRVDRHAVVPDPPCAGDVEVVQRQADRIDHAMARRARRIRAVLLHPLAHGAEPSILRLRGRLEVGHVRRRGRRRRAEQHFHHPLASKHRRRAVGVRGERQNAAVSQQPLPPAVRIRRFAELTPDHVRDSVVLRQPLVHERVVRGEQLPHRPVLADDVAEEQLGLAEHRRLELVVEIRVAAHVGIDLVEVLQPQPLRGETRRQHVGAAIGQHPPRLPFERRGVSQPARLRHAHQLLVRTRRPEEKRQSRGEVEIAQRVGLACRCERRPLLEAEHEPGARQDAFERHPDAPFETAFGRALVVERHQRVDIALGSRAPERLRGETRHDFARADHLLRPAVARPALWRGRPAVARSALAGLRIHVRIFRRLGVGETPVTASGPVMARSRRCGRVVIP